jgi:hypothetical protein
MLLKTRPARSIALTAAFALSLAAQTVPAAAGNGTFKNAQGDKIRINCKNTGCTVRSKLKGQKWSIVSKSEGGRPNYLKLVDEYKAQGYK